MVFGWQRSSRQPKGSRLVRASSTATPRPSAAPAVGRHVSLSARTAPPRMVAPAPPTAEDACEVVPQFFPGYQHSPSASTTSFYPGPAAPANAPAHASQRRAGSVQLRRLDTLPEDHRAQCAGGPRRCSDGSTLSTSSTLFLQQPLSAPPTAMPAGK
ncbi:hypothetical protein GGI07_000978 [Coemansia sp. Benny D115]|nr:hypothetical protein GGI07_000978 [Coemansia sp. Benny D115]